MWTGTNSATVVHAHEGSGVIHCENPAIVAHRYALALPIDTLVLGVKNRAELRECVRAAERGPLDHTASRAHHVPR